MTNQLFEIKNQLKNYHNDRKSIMINSINERLNNSLLSYFNAISNSFNYLQFKKADNVIKHIK